MIQGVDIQTETTQVKTQVLNKLLELSESMLRGDFSHRVLADFDDEIITKIADNLNRFADQVQLNAIGKDYNQEQTIDTFIEVISSFANLDFKKKLPISENGTIMDAIATGINVLGDELEQSIASKQELETERNRLNEAQAIAKVGSWELDAPSFQLRWSNEAYRIFELEKLPAPLLFEACSKKIHPEDLARVDAVFMNAIEKKEGVDLEHRIICEDGSIKYILCIGEVVKNDKVAGVCLKGMLQDITERKMTEETLRKAKEYAEEANNGKSMFLANMSHEIRTPLNGILGLTEIMLGEGVNERQRKYLEIIGSSGQNLTLLINDILDFSKIESGKLQLENIMFNFNEVISSNINRYQFLADQKGLTLSCHIDKSIPRDVIGDPTRISQVLTNLIGNAIKFTFEGTVEIAFSLLENNNGEVVIQGVVKDTGIGIPKEKESAIFQSFTQADEAVTRKYGGTGLGLSIVKSLLLQMNGDIRVQSPVDPILNTGSAFTFRLTLKLPVQQAGPASPVNAGGKKRAFTKSLHFLIVDDNAVNLLVAKKMVQKFGAKVTTAKSGKEAINLVAANDYDMVLMDVQMPDLDGHDATRELRKLNYTKPIVALSANAYADDIQNSLHAGMNDHLQKPYTEEKLFQMLARYVE
jgi:signal transduction histidine kinase/CheY-like chemotaxis protein